jgi:hypothetical protein
MPTLGSRISFLWRHKLHYVLETELGDFCLLCWSTFATKKHKCTEAQEALSLRNSRQTNVRFVWLKLNRQCAKC